MRFTRRLLFIIFLFITIFSSLFTFNKNVYAETFPNECSVSAVYDGYNPDQAISPEKKYKKLEIHVDTDGGLKDSYWIRIEGPGLPGAEPSFLHHNQNIFVFNDEATVRLSRDRTVDVFNPQEGKIIIPELSTGLQINYGGDIDDWLVGDYTLTIYREGESSSPRCQATFEIQPSEQPGGSGSSDYCKVVLDEENTLKNDDKVKFRVEFGDDYKDQNSVKNADHSHRVKLKTDNYGERMNTEYRTDELGTGENPGLAPKDDQGLSTGGYYLEVFENASSIIFFDEGKNCRSDYFSISTVGGDICSDADNIDQCGFQPKRPLAQPCRQEDWDPDKGCIRIKTALGTIGTEAPEFVRWVLGFVLGISGGIVLIIIIISGYRLMTSQGDPEKVKNARDQLTSAVVGLIFIIFSLVILQLITKNILQLPGFGG